MCSTDLMSFVLHVRVGSSESLVANSVLFGKASVFCNIDIKNA